MNKKSEEEKSKPKLERKVYWGNEGVVRSKDTAEDIIKDMKAGHPLNEISKRIDALFGDEKE